MSSEKKKQPIYTKFLIAAAGGSSGWLFIHPFDVCKVRLQINVSNESKTFINALSDIYKNEGFKGFYSGLSAALTRQLTYTTLRLGLYDVFREQVVNYNLNKYNYNGINIWQKLATGLTAGGIAASLCCPVEVALIRMQVK